MAAPMEEPLCPDWSQAVRMAKHRAGAPLREGARVLHDSGARIVIAVALAKPEHTLASVFGSGDDDWPGGEAA